MMSPLRSVLVLAFGCTFTTALARTNAANDELRAAQTLVDALFDKSSQSWLELVPTTQEIVNDAKRTLPYVSGETIQSIHEKILADNGVSAQANARQRLQAGIDFCREILAEARFEMTADNRRQVVVSVKKDNRFGGTTFVVVSTADGNRHAFLRFGASKTGEHCRASITVPRAVVTQTVERVEFRILFTPADYYFERRPTKLDGHFLGEAAALDAPQKTPRDPIFQLTLQFRLDGEAPIAKDILWGATDFGSFSDESLRYTNQVLDARKPIDLDEGTEIIRTIKGRLHTSQQRIRQLEQQKTPAEIIAHLRALNRLTLEKATLAVVIYPPSEVVRGSAP